MAKLYPSEIIFSFDLESSGLHAEVGQPYLLEFAMIPMSLKSMSLIQKPFHVYLKCPSVDEMKAQGKISDFVLGNQNLMQVAKKAHKEGIGVDEAKDKIIRYLDEFKIDSNDKNLRPKAVILSKSTGGLDRRLIGEVFGDPWVEELFTHQMIDITSNANFVLHAQLGIIETRSPKKLVAHLLGKDDVAHTALQDAIDMGHVYLELVKRVSAIRQERDELKRLIEELRES
ncbi:hypothetical protein [Pseudobacteriovorax antillogorgiicola]|uniref:Exonuclease n=1 Tax=Pseudobacteriovorax antillogorgiicola TaxID=1513793 RepID=A0A1Y6BSM9_9BACT|nr:hypothetical protein [Pseudobacteriovorax antillogorgiicola]TCS53061.1 hypothetical protein EDD56_108112 [Pseudobacteriovorax antillogorgiicola]SMF26328.1 hypothetical protein SAMN06296036_108135 [Pseudobacteriovorax antillogorgiicola]